MIGIICEPGEEPSVREFFELFKTPWAMFDPAASYEAVIVTGKRAAEDVRDVKVVIRFGDASRHDDAELGVTACDHHERALLEADGGELPLYCGATGLAGPGRARARIVGESTSIVLECERGGMRIVRCGYSLFDEVKILLSRGQPIEHAGSPTLDLHIALVRRWLVEAGVELVEIHPTPPGCGLLASLTHDVDFMGIRRHTRDRTLIGFLYRASIGSVTDVIRGRGSIRRMLRNWFALATLPFVYAGLREDFWLPFERYVEADSPCRSTFFVIPFRARPGMGPEGGIVRGRAVPYQASEIGPELRALVARGHEVSVHGIDAWRDSAAGTEELAAVSEAAGTEGLGVRMHWLYFDGTSFGNLEDAGFEYDATVGYNETVGFRAGTSQVFAPLGTKHLLELPLHIQDTSLLYPGRMHCREDEAVNKCRQVVDMVRRHGGVATVSWHERSLVPERLWDRVYDQVLAILRSSDASIRPAREVVAWFRVRRSVNLERTSINEELISCLATATGADEADALRIRVYHPTIGAAGNAGGYTEFAVSARSLNAALQGARQPVRS